MLTVSCYHLHHLVKRFLVVWRYAQIVSECLTFLLSCLCCQCTALMPLENASSEDKSVEAFKIMSETAIEAGRACGEPFHPQHLVIDFTPQAEDSEVTSLKCQQFWDHLRTHPDLDGLMVSPDDDAEMVLKEFSSVPVHRPSFPYREPVLPALHTIEHLNERGAVDAAFVTRTSRHKY